MAANKIFLSHKGSDKNTVIDFEKTLKLLGYSPWLDDDAIPAGATLDRAIYKGMQASCAVVFFLTPSFKDAGYLRTEIDYAIAEKRDKKGAFSIIGLRFSSKDKPLPPVPKLLQTYVWKEPTTQLEALREIIRALPDIAGPVVEQRTEAAVLDQLIELGGRLTTVELGGRLTTESEMISYMHRAYMFVCGLGLPKDSEFGQARAEEVVDFTIRDIPNAGDPPAPNKDKVARILGVLQGLKADWHKLRGQRYRD